MTRILITFLFIFLTSCSTNENEWIHLFDGKAVKGMRGYTMDSFPWGSWEIVDGRAEWAAGIQYRKDNYEFSVEDVANRAINPCPFSNSVSITLGHTQSLDCGSGGAGQLAFLAATDEESTSRKIYAVFTELALPLSNNIDMQIAARFEDYGSSGGSSFA